MSVADKFIVITSGVAWTNTIITTDDDDDAMKVDNAISNLTRIQRGWSLRNENRGAITVGEDVQDNAVKQVVREFANGFNKTHLF